MVTKKNDWIEIDFSASIKDGALFETTIKSDAEKAGMKTEKGEFEPLVVCIGQGMILKGLDDSLEGKEIGREYTIELEPKEAFGQRNSALIRTVPLSAFQERPVQGMWVNVDGITARVASVTSGRALLDFNPPLAGKFIVYKVKILKEVKEPEKKVKAVLKAAGLTPLEAKLEDKKAKVKIKEKGVSADAIKVLGQKVKELIDFELVVE
jgi:peptidylprolyl isomerase